MIPAIIAFGIFVLTRAAARKNTVPKNRVYYEYYCLDRTEVVPADYIEISFVCLRPDGCLELPAILETVFRKIEKIRETTVDASIN